MKRINLWTLSVVLSCGSFVMSSCVDSSDNPYGVPYEVGIDEMVPDSLKWATCNLPVYFSGISNLSLELQQALGMCFPNTVSSMDEAKIAIVDVPTAIEKVDELADYYENDGLVVLLTPDLGNYEKTEDLGYDNLDGWDEMLWASHNEREDFYLINEPDEVVMVDENGKEQTQVIVKDLDYYNVRLKPLINWINGYDDDDDNAMARTRGDNSNLPDFEQVTVSMKSDAKRYTINFPFSLYKVIDEATWSDPDVLNKEGSITLHFEVMPLYMNSANNDNAGDYYAVRSEVTPHNTSMWGPFVGKHGWTRNRVYGYWFNDLQYKFILTDPDTKAPVADLEFAAKPFPENSISSRNMSNEFTFGLKGAVTAGVEVDASGPKAKVDASFGFSCEWKESVSYSLANIDYDRNSSTNWVDYRWYSNNVVLDDDMDNYGKYFPDDCHKEFTAKTIWLWHVPHGSAGVKDDSKKTFNLTAYVCPRYSSWYHWRATATFNSNRVDYEVGFSRNYVSRIQGLNADLSRYGWAACSFALPMPNRSKWGLISLKNASNNYTVRNVKVYKKGEEDKKPVAEIPNTYAPTEQALTAVGVGTYTVTFEFINPDNNTLISKGKITDVNVSIGKTKSEATTSISTGDATLE